MLVELPRGRQGNASDRIFLRRGRQRDSQASRVLPNGETLSPAYPSVGESCRMMATPTTRRRAGTLSTDTVRRNPLRVIAFLRK